MFRSKRYIQNIIFLIPILTLILVYPRPVPTSAEISFADDEKPAFQLPVPEKSAPAIWQLCEENNLAYALVIAILHIDSDPGVPMNDTGDIKELIQQLADYRDYWREQGYTDETVFDLILLSKQRGIEGCKTFIQNNASWEDDPYVQKVTAYKYFLDQIDDNGTLVSSV